ncbi:AzlC family ABC transporter permease [Dinoroseobacter sp. S124A]|uniref:AzlC family ABC transporter permease n=1 Tax=Dinoroseobacter sp. S124A TaxID=3415128 RepID=UPI003C7B45A4
MTPDRPDRPYLDGLLGGLPFLLVVIPFGLLFGVVGTEAGLNIAEVMGFSLLVIAGAAQFTAVQLMTENAPVLVILASALAVNLRMAMYSASIAPYLGPLPLWQRALCAYFLVDQTYAVSIARFQARPEMSLRARFAFHLGTATPICLLWYPSTYLGAVLGTRIPPDYALDFALPITFLALIAPALTSLAHVAAALTATVLSLLFVGIPFSLGIILAALCALLVGAQVELWQTRRREGQT